MTPRPSPETLGLLRPPLFSPPWWPPCQRVSQREGSQLSAHVLGRRALWSPGLHSVLLHSLCEHQRGLPPRVLPVVEKVRWAFPATTKPINDGVNEVFPSNKALADASGSSEAADVHETFLSHRPTNSVGLEEKTTTQTHRNRRSLNNRLSFFLQDDINGMGCIAFPWTSESTSRGMRSLRAPTWPSTLPAMAQPQLLWTSKALSTGRWWSEAPEMIRGLQDLLGEETGVGAPPSPVVSKALEVGFRDVVLLKIFIARSTTRVEVGRRAFLSPRNYS
ncbi:uncharacterized protein LOC128850462 [Cuculus canorus]|uniref:uncharacterized protein LOC128850462 n=1 Tax=Cuculus canorus TaxID=55661 RepID=UPI0023AA9DD5|nr:uncharacterized protein LOC128850462 [Cuculus canorus]